MDSCAVANAFLIMFLVTSIYAILGVSFWKERSEEYFGTFTKSLFTLFQVPSRAFPTQIRGVL